MAINALIAQGIRPIGADLPEVGQMLNQKRQMDTRNALAMRDQQIQEQNANAYQESLGLQRQNALAQGEAAQQKAMRERAGAVLDNLQSMVGTPQYGAIVQQLQQAPQVVEGARAMGLDVSRLSDPNYLPVARGIIGMEAAPAPVSLSAENVGGFGVLRDSTGKVINSQAPERPQAVGGMGAPPSGYRYTPDGNLTFVPGGPADPARKNDVLRPIPAPVAKGIIENRQRAAQIERAIAAVQANPGAFGAKNYLPDALIQRTDPGGVDPRGQVADIGSMVINDRSGAAVSAAEFPRLRPFIPAATDDDKTVITKLTGMLRNIQALNEESEAMYSEQSGYKPLTASQQPAANPPAAPAASGGFTIRKVR